MVADALSRKACSLNAMLKERLPALYEELEGFGLELLEPGSLANLEVKPTLMEDVKEAQKGHESIEGIKRKFKAGKAPSFSEDEQGVVWFGNHICMPNKTELKNLDVTFRVDDFSYKNFFIRVRMQKLCAFYKFPERFCK